MEMPPLHAECLGGCRLPLFRLYAACVVIKRKENGTSRGLIFFLFFLESYFLFCYLDVQDLDDRINFRSYV
jgi:uncharacterized membrane protein YozB (DUF420 family)